MTKDMVYTYTNMLTGAQSHTHSQTHTDTLTHSLLTSYTQGTRSVPETADNDLIMT